MIITILAEYTSSFQTKKLWMNFVRSIISLRRGLLNAKPLEKFLSWVKEAVLQDIKGISTILTHDNGAINHQGRLIPCV